MPLHFLVIWPLKESLTPSCVPRRDTLRLRSLLVLNVVSPNAIFKQTEAHSSSSPRTRSSKDIYIGGLQPLINLRLSGAIRHMPATTTSAPYTSMVQYAASMSSRLMLYGLWRQVPSLHKYSVRSRKIQITHSELTVRFFAV